MDETPLDSLISQPTGGLIKLLVNNEELSDVKFLVGAEKKLIYAHKMMLARLSPVFRAMFYADHDLKSDGDQPIKIPDLTPNGFMNMLRYIYGYLVESMELNELYDTYMAANKYFVYGLTGNIIRYMNSILNSKNCVIIYDQMIDLEEQIPSDLASVKNMTQVHARTSFMSDHFVKIRLETLISLLSSRYLNINEIEILKACYRWVEFECSRNNLDLNRSNMQKAFASIKNFIRFDEITFDQLKGLKIHKLLSNDELASLLVHLVDSKKKICIDCQAFRKNTFDVASFDASNLPHSDCNSQTFKFIMSVNCDINLKKIMTNFRYNSGYNTLKEIVILGHDGQSISFKAEKMYTGDMWYVDFNPAVRIETGQEYTLDFTIYYCYSCQMPTLSNSSYNLEFKDEREDESIVITIQKFETDQKCYALIRCIEFYPCE